VTGFGTLRVMLIFDEVPGAFLNLKKPDHRTGLSTFREITTPGKTSKRGPGTVNEPCRRRKSCTARGVFFQAVRRVNVPNGPFHNVGTEWWVSTEGDTVFLL